MKALCPAVEWMGAHGGCRPRCISIVEELMQIGHF